MITPGLVSVTFRKLSAFEIIKLALAASAKAVEWGGDIHVPHGNVLIAKEIAKAAADVGLATASYGSYYFTIKSETDGLQFERVLETAVALEAPNIRIWAGNIGSSEADAVYWDKMISESQRIASLAQSAGISISYEFHHGTLTDSPDSAQKLLSHIAHSNLKIYWQQEPALDTETNVASIDKVLPWLSNIHVFHWIDNKRQPLETGRDRWQRYFNKIKQTPQDRYALLEFLKDDNTVQFINDIRTLTDMLK